MCISAFIMNSAQTAFDFYCSLSAFVLGCAAIHIGLVTLHMQWRIFLILKYFDKAVMAINGKNNVYFKA